MKCTTPGAPNSRQTRHNSVIQEELQRGSKVLTKGWGSCNNLFFLRDEISTFYSFYAKRLKRPTFKNLYSLKNALFDISTQGVLKKAYFKKNYVIKGSTF